MSINFDNFQPARIEKEIAGAKKAAGSFTRRERRDKAKEIAQKSSLTVATEIADVGAIGRRANRQRVAGEGPSLTQTKQQNEGTLEHFMAAWDTQKYGKPTGGEIDDPEREQVRKEAFALLKDGQRFDPGTTGMLRDKLKSAKSAGVTIRPGELTGFVQETPPDPEQSSAERQARIGKQVEGGLPELLSNDDATLFQDLRDETAQNLGKFAQDWNPIGLTDRVLGRDPSQNPLNVNLSNVIGQMLASPFDLAAAVEFAGDEKKPGFDRSMAAAQVLLMGIGLKGSANAFLESKAIPKDAVRNIIEEAEKVAPTPEIKVRAQEVLSEITEPKALAGATKEVPETSASYLDAEPTTIQVETPLSRTRSERRSQPVQSSPEPEPPSTLPKDTKVAVMEPEGTALANRSARKARENAGLPELAKPDRKPLDEMAKIAKAQGYGTDEGALKIAERIENGGKSLSDDETVGIASAVERLSKEHDDLSVKYLATAEKGGDPELAARLDDVREKINRLTTDGNMAGTEWGRSGAARQAVMKADTSVAGVLARRQKDLDRPLTAGEIETANKQVKDLNDAIAAKDARITQLESERAQAALTKMRVSPRATARARSAPIDAKIKDVSERLSKKWEESRPKDVMRASVFGVDVAAEQLLRLSKVTPEILELSRLYATKGVVHLSEHTKAVVQHLKSLGIDDIGENDVAAVLAGKTRMTEERAVTGYQEVRRQAREAFSDVAKDRKQRESLARQTAKEEGRRLNRWEKATQKIDAKQEKELERLFMKSAQGEIGSLEKLFKRGERRKARLAREESVRRFQTSLGAEQERAGKRIAGLHEKLKGLEESGVMPGAKSKLNPYKGDPTLRELEIREAAARNALRKADLDNKAQAELDKLPAAMRFVKQYNPWSATRSIVASFDNSFPMNQGAMALASDPGRWLKGFVGSLRSMSEPGLTRIKAEVRAHPLWEQAEAAGLIEESADIADAFGTGYSKLPGVVHSQRAYEGGAQALRMDLFAGWSDIAETAGGKALTLDDYKAIAKEVKTWTGQGDWGKGEGISKIGKPLFAIRYGLTQAEIALGAPVFRTAAHGLKTGNWGAFKLMSRKYARAYTTAVATLGATNAAMEHLGPKGNDGKPVNRIEMNPLATDFGRWVHRKSDGTTITRDLLPPPMRLFGQFVKLATGERITKDGEQKRAGRAQIVGEYGTNRLHPVLSQLLAIAEAAGKEDKKRFDKRYDMSTGEGWANVGLGFTPISFQTARDIWFNDSLSAEDKAWALALLPFVNQGVHKPKDDQPATSATTKTYTRKTLPP